MPLKIMYPEDYVPCIQLSLLNSLDPREHINIGNALSGLEYENLLVIGSGFSFHNMNAFFAPRTAGMEMKNEAFMRWLNDTCSDQSLGENERTHRLVNWEKAPLAFEEIGLPARPKETTSAFTHDGGLPSFDEMVCGYIKRVLDTTNGKIHGPGGAAEVMAINSSTLRSKISKLGIRYIRKS